METKQNNTNPISKLETAYRPDRSELALAARELRKKKYLEVLAGDTCLGNRLSACRVSGIPMATVSFWLNDDAEFEKSVDLIVKTCKEQEVLELEHVARSMALDKNWNAVKFSLMNKAPDKWKDRRGLDHTEPINYVVTLKDGFREVLLRLLDEQPAPEDNRSE